MWTKWNYIYEALMKYFWIAKSFLGKHMKTVYTAIVSLLVMGCATNYKPLNFTEKSARYDEDENLKISCQHGDFEANNRITGKAIFNNIDIIKCKIVNKTESVVSIAELNDSIAKNKDTKPFLGNAQAYRILSFTQNGYWVYALPIGIGFTFGSAGSGGNIGYKGPIGIVMGILTGILNWGIAKSANNDFRSELKKYELKSQVNPSDSANRLFFLDSKAAIDSLNLGYMKNGTPWKINIKLTGKYKT